MKPIFTSQLKTEKQIADYIESQNLGDYYDPVILFCSNCNEEFIPSGQDDKLCHRCEDYER